ncbi:MAG TPA: hypothetical protein IAD28_01030 [Candidatus Faeciplasma avium]|uniref:P22 coat protein-protein 5 domain protein n=1 Tax=Candidatus Faeciplasma avium TaxID=2840798 RepID=A0A9D1NPP1_9FIRM|nr:hypothetical protein [Candidatus Faeciplasma avium]
MAVTNFIPELWSARLLQSLEKTHVAANLVNRDYEGEIRQQGDTVHINMIGAITVRDYTKGSDIVAPEELSTTDQTLVISQAKYFNFQIDDVDAAQVAGSLMDSALARSAYALKDAADSYILKTIADGLLTENTIGSSAAVALTKDNIYENIIKLRLILDRNNVPLEGRTIVIPPEAYALLLQDSRFVSGDIGSEALRSGYIGSVAGFEIYESNNCSKSDSTYTITAQVRSACTYAEQIVETGAYRPEKRFADAVKGLHVYGAKVVDQTQIAGLLCTF